MKTIYSFAPDASEMESIVSVCCGNPNEDELPQIAGEEDILIDIYSDMLNMPRESASVLFHHQYGDFDIEDVIH